MNEIEEKKRARAAALAMRDEVALLYEEQNPHGPEMDLIKLLRRCGVRTYKGNDIEIEFQPGQLILTEAESSLSVTDEAREQQTSATEPGTTLEESQQAPDSLDVMHLDD